MPYVAPTFMLTAFNCPFCGAYSDMSWYEANKYCNRSSPPGQGFEYGHSLYFNTAQCRHCDKFSAWMNSVMYVPTGGNAPLPHEDMPESVLAVYQEAANVSQFSPRAAIALQRLALENLVQALGAEGKDINTQIGDLVKKGLSPVVQQSLDSLRVLGNEAVHIGTVDVGNGEICASLFRLLNLIVEQMITVPQHVQDVYELLPENKVKGIEQRDRNGEG